MAIFVIKLKLRGIICEIFVRKMIEKGVSARNEELKREKT